MQTITTIGLDIAKSVFQVHGVDAGGRVAIRRQIEASPRLGFLSEAAAMPCRHRSLRLIAPLVARAQGARPYGTADTTCLR